MPTRPANSGGIVEFARERVRWIRVIKLPAFLLLAMTLSALAVSGYTHQIDLDSERLIAESNQLVAGVQEASSADATRL